MLWAKKYQFSLVAVSIISLLVFIFAQENISYHNFLFVIVLPLFIRHLYVVSKADTSRKFDPELKKLAISTLFLVLVFGVGLIL